MKYPETDSVRDLGRIDTAAHSGAVDDATKAMGYHKQNVTNTESILTILGGAAIQLRTEQSISASVEENALMQFSIGLMDVDSGAVASDDIDITGISAVIEKSTGGGAFSSAGLTAITFGKEAGRVFVDYQFKAAEWAVGDVYKIVVTGIEATVGGDTAYVPAMVWSNFIVEHADVKAAVDRIEATIGAVDTAAAEGAVTDADLAMAYIKQIVTEQLAFPTNTGVAQIHTTTIDLNQAASAYDLFTGSTHDVVLESLSVKMPTEAAGGALTSISVATDDVTPAVLIDSTDGAVGNLTSEAELVWTGSAYITVGTKIQLTIAGGAHGSTYTCKVTAKLRATATGGTVT